MTRWLLLLVTLFPLLGSAIATEEESAATLVEFEVNLSPGKIGSFTIEVHRDWAPVGADRFLELVDIGDDFWKGARFFRVIDGFMAQFGIAGKPDVAAEWKMKTIVDDEVVKSNERGYISFATSGKDSRTSQMFINLVDNQNLDDMGFAPFGIVTEGMESVVDQLFNGYGEGAPGGEGPNQSRIQAEGNRYLKKQFPNLSYIKSVRVVGKAEEEL